MTDPLPNPLLFPTLSRYGFLRFAHLTSADLSTLRHRPRGGGRVRSRPGSAGESSQPTDRWAPYRSVREFASASLERLLRSPGLQARSPPRRPIRLRHSPPAKPQLDRVIGANVVLPSLLRIKPPRPGRLTDFTAGEAISVTVPACKDRRRINRGSSGLAGLRLTLAFVGGDLQR